MSGDIASFKNTRYWLYYLVSWFTTVNLGELTQVNAIMRKIGHGLSYGILYFLWFRALRGHGEYGPGRAFIWSLGFCLFYASMDEGRQWFYASRGASISDVILDMFGASLAAPITAAVWRPRPPALSLRITGGHATGPE